MPFAYNIRRSTRARSLGITIYPDSRVIVVVPRRHVGDVEPFVKKHTSWVVKHLARAKNREVIHIKRCDIRALKRRAQHLAHERAAHFARHYRVSFSKITIRAQKSRWGSCSRAGNLSFNYRLAALTREIADYIVVHEICHLRHMHHGSAFWNMVEECVPHQYALRKRLRNITFVFD